MIMATEVESDPQVGVTTLIGGIVQDARALFIEQMTLFQVEIKNDVRRTTAALTPLMAGVGVVLAGLVLLGIATAYFLIWAIPEMPFWVAYAAVGAVFAVAGGSLVMWGKSMLSDVNPTLDTALKGLKENIQWKTKK
jgi:uncharacterized membrane protein YqjE